MTNQNCNQRLVNVNGQYGYFSPFEPTMPGVQDPSAQLRPQQAPPQPKSPYILGRIVNGVDDITAFDVPMEGETLFPLADGSAIVKKKWANDGSIIDTIYIASNDPYINKEETRSNNDQIDELRKEISERFDKIERLCGRKYNNSYHKPSKYEGKKGGDQHE